MFSFVVKNLALKDIPLLAILFDSLMRLWMFIVKPELLHWIDDLEENVERMPGRRLGYINMAGLRSIIQERNSHMSHSNGLVDILLNKELKKSLMMDGKIKDHHLFKNSGWISFYLHNKQDVAYACYLLKKAYDRAREKQNSVRQALIVQSLQ
jgi:predicted DNA-binding protein (MmcQ/YjbR family)